MNRLLKIAFYCLLVFIGLLVGIMLVSQTGFFKNWLQEKIVTVANNSLNGKVTSLTLSGNFISNINLEDVVVEIENEPFFKAKRLSINYLLSPLELIANQIAISRIRLESPEFFLSRDVQQIWNFSELVKN